MKRTCIPPSLTHRQVSIQPPKNKGRLRPAGDPHPANLGPLDRGLRSSSVSCRCSPAVEQAASAARSTAETVSRGNPSRGSFRTTGEAPGTYGCPDPSRLRQGSGGRPLRAQPRSMRDRDSRGEKKSVTGSPSERRGSPRVHIGGQRTGSQLVECLGPEWDRFGTRGDGPTQRADLTRLGSRSRPKAPAGSALRAEKTREP